MQSPKIFQAVLVGIFVVLLAVGMLAFSGKLPKPTSESDINYGEVVLWGTIPTNAILPIISPAGIIGSEPKVTIKYIEKDKSTIDQEFIEALAAGNGPDIIMLPQDGIAKNLNKVTVIPYQSVSENFFKNTFLEEGELFLRPEGSVALPFVLDPIVMYWNRDIFTNFSLVNPPTKWKEFYTLAPRITARDTGGNIKRSFVAFGEYNNVTNAKDILSLLIMQSGSSIVETQGDFSSATLARSVSVDTPSPAAGAVRFFMEFSRPDKDSYSWNRSLPSSRSMFESGGLALYFGYASEYLSIVQRNPHLNFGVAVVPQAEQTTVKSTLGSMSGLSIVKASKNQAGAMYAILLFTRADVQLALAQNLKLPPVRRDLIVNRPSDAVSAVFYDSAIIARGWRDPSPRETDQLFRTMVESIGAGRAQITEALLIVQEGINKLLQNR